MIPALVAGGLLVAVLALLRVFGLPQHAVMVIRVTRTACLDLANRELSDDDRERAIQGHARAVSRQCLRLAAGTAAAVLIPTAAMLLMDRAGVVRLADVVAVSMSAWFLVSSVALGALVLGLRGRQ